MGTSEETLLGRIAVQANLITLDQLAEATREQARKGGGVSLGDIFLERGFLTPAELERLVQLQKSVRARIAGQREATAKAPPPQAPSAPKAVAASPQPTPPAPAPAAKPAPRAAAPPVAEGATAATEEARPTTRPAKESSDPGLSLQLAEPLSGGPKLGALLQQAVEAGASDLHVHPGTPIKLRIRGQLEDVGEALTPEAAEQLVLQSLTPQERKLLGERGEIDLCYSLPGVGRFRGNVYRELRGLDGTFRVIPEQVPSLADLGLPDSLAKFTNYHQGMVLITGPTRCGKTATMAALVNLINEERAEHILTIEDPIEYLHPSSRCIVNQRHVSRHTESFARALRGALREDPDVIVIGELRDTETISLALTAAETGHFVLATLHTDGATRTVDRLVGAFPPSQQEQTRTMLSESMRAVISQKLIPTADGQRLVPALEILVVNRAVGKVIRDNRTFQLGSVIQTGVGQGMCLLDHSLASLIASGTISREEALHHCTNVKLLDG